VIECEFNSTSQITTVPVYQCRVSNELNLDSGEAATIRNVTGHHKLSMSNNNVTSFYAEHQNFEIFPFGLEKIFKNLQDLTIRNCSLSRISQANLLPFHNLTHLCLAENIIKKIPKGTFYYNIHLKSIDISKNQIFHIDSNVFDHLPNLTSLRLSHNFCIDENVDDNKSEVQQVIKSVRILCQYKDIKEIHKLIYRNIKNLKQTSKMIYAITKRYLNENDKNESFRELAANTKNIEERLTSLRLL
jgi:hypothetical protein